MPKIINLEQGSPEWHTLRKNRLGASEASIVLGISPYMTAFQLWQYKLGLLPDQFEHHGMKQGKVYEDYARNILNSSVQNQEDMFYPCVVESESLPFMMASLDGLTQNKTKACEIKCLNIEDHNEAISGKILPHYYAQIQHQCYVCNLDEIIYLGYNPNSNLTIYCFPIKRDEAFLADYIPKAIAFWKCVETFDPPALCEKDYRDYSKNAEYVSLDAAYVDIDEKIKGLEKQREELRKLMEQMSEGNNVKGLYTKMTYYTSQGRIDYKKAVTENLPDLNLEKYRGAPILATRITKV